MNRSAARAGDDAHALAGPGGGGQSRPEPRDRVIPISVIAVLIGFAFAFALAGCASEPATADATCARLGPDGQPVFFPCTIVAAE